MWFAIMGALMLIALLCCWYLIRCVHRFPAFQRLGEKRKLLSWLLAALPVLALGLFGLINVFALMVVILHVAAAFLLCALLAWLFKKPIGCGERLPSCWPRFI